ncbi:MAG: isoprenyl transferase [Phycisphaeraceae bacterium]|nr:MAG: isoprenyl transferase [Phycisphaeraceae bacterium]
MRLVNPGADPLAVLPDVDPERIPRHIAIIMDGNGRWARQRGAPRIAGHKAGADSVRRTMEACATLGVEALTLFSFSSENWRRPAEEIEALMGLYSECLRAERDQLIEKNIRFRQIGRREGLPTLVLAEVDKTIEATSRCTGPTLCLAVNYGARAEIVDAARELASRVARGELSPEAITEDTFESVLSTAGMPEPDLLIRTAGEMRLSNFLLWQISYAEIHVTDVQWPEFGAADLHNAVRDYASRRRRFGGLDDA